MGKPKLLLPWGGRPIITHVIRQLFRAEAGQILVVVGDNADQLMPALAGLEVVTVFNPHHAEGEMLSSIQAGLSAAPAEAEAALVVLGDQPQLESETVAAILQQYRNAGSSLIVPSYQDRRGHPWLIHRSFWPDILAMSHELTMRDFFHRHSAEIDHLVVDTPSVLQDIDTPEDYERMRPDSQFRETGKTPVRTWKVQGDVRKAFDIPSTPDSLDSATRQLPSGAYTTFRTFDGSRVLHLDAHFNRLVETARLSGVNIQPDFNQLRAHLRSAIQEVGLPEVRIRLILDTTANPGDQYILVEPLTLPPDELYQKGAVVATRHMQRKNPRAKRTSFIEHSSGVRANLADGIFEILMLTDDGRILEGLTSNFFTICGDELWTAEEGVLPGITRSIVIEEAAAAGLQLQMRAITMEQLASCSEAFLTSSSRGVLPVRQVDALIVGDGSPGQRTLDLSRRYQERIRREAQPI